MKNWKKTEEFEFVSTLINTKVYQETCFEESVNWNTLTWLHNRENSNVTLLCRRMLIKCQLFTIYDSISTISPTLPLPERRKIYCRTFIQLVVKPYWTIDAKLASPTNQTYRRDCKLVENHLNPLRDPDTRDFDLPL